MRERRDVYRILVGNPKGKRSIVRPRRRWEGNIKTDFYKWDGEAWICVIWLRMGQVASTCECGNEPSDSIKYGKFLD
jgi:hypothetical protein